MLRASFFRGTVSGAPPAEYQTQDGILVINASSKNRRMSFTLYLYSLPPCSSHQLRDLPLDVNRKGLKYLLGGHGRFPPHRFPVLSAPHQEAEKMRVAQLPESWAPGRGEKEMPSE